MDVDVFEHLNNLGYTSIADLDGLNQIIDKNENLASYSRIVSWLTHELGDLCKIDERVHSIDSLNDVSSFSLEINSFLKEIKCPYQQLNENSALKLNERYLSRENKLLLLTYLCSELEAASMLAFNNPTTQSTNTKTESNEASALKKLLMSLGFPKPPATITWPQLWSKVEMALKDTLGKLPQNYLGKPMMNASLTAKQWSTVLKINRLLNDDFKLRREMLLKRLDVTIQSFKWADRLKAKNDEIQRMFDAKRKELDASPSVTLGDLLAARDDLCNQEKTCSTRNMTRTELHKIIIPKVPDRGGRTGELQPPPPEMPAFMQRQQQHHQQQQAPQRQRVQSGRPDSGGRGGHYDSGRNWSNQQYDQQQRNYQPPQQQYYDQQYRPQSDFERFQNQDYYDRDTQYQRGGGRGGRGRGGRGGNRY